MSIDQALAACITAVEQGASVEQCLADYPEYAAEFEPILRLIHQTHSSALPPMSDAGFARGRRRVFQAARLNQRLRHSDAQRPLGAALDRRALFGNPHKGPSGEFLRAGWTPTQHPVHPAGAKTILPQSPLPPSVQPPVSMGTAARGRSIPSRFFTLPTAVGMGLAACLLVGIFLFGQVVNQSLPGSPLYTLKRGTEQMESALVNSESDRAHLLARSTARRLDELVTLESQKRAIEPLWLAEVQDQATRTLAAGMSLPPEERVLFLDEWLHTLRSLEQSAALAAAPHPATLAVVQRAVVDIEASLIEEALVVLAPTPTQPLGPDAPASAGAESTTSDTNSSEDAAASDPQVEDAAGPVTSDQVAMATPDEARVPQVGQASADEAAALAEDAPDGDDAGEGSAPDVPTSTESAPSESAGREAETAPTQNGQTGTVAATSTPVPATGSTGAQPLATPSPTWTTEAVPTLRPTGGALALAEQPRETAASIERPGEEIDGLPERPSAEGEADPDAEHQNGETAEQDESIGDHTHATTSVGPSIVVSLTVTPTLTMTPTVTATTTVVPGEEDTAPDMETNGETGTETNTETPPANGGTPTLIPTYTPSPSGVTPTPTASPTPVPPTETPTPGASGENGNEPTPDPTATVVPAENGTESATVSATPNPTATGESLSGSGDMRSRSTTGGEGTPAPDASSPVTPVPDSGTGN